MTYPCDPPESDGNSSAATATSHVNSQVLTATKAGAKRTTARPVTSAATTAAAIDTGSAAIGGQPARPASTDVVSAPMLMNAPCASDGRPAKPTATTRPLAAS